VWHNCRCGLSVAYVGLGRHQRRIDPDGRRHQCPAPEVPRLLLCGRCERLVQEVEGGRYDGDGSVMPIPSAKEHKCRAKLVAVAAVPKAPAHSSGASQGPKGVHELAAYRDEA